MGTTGLPRFGGFRQKGYPFGGSYTKDYNTILVPAIFGHANLPSLSPISSKPETLKTLNTYTPVKNPIGNTS